MKLQWKIDLFILIMILGAGVFFWLGSYSGNAASVHTKSYGGKLSNQVICALDNMKKDLEKAQGILTANSFHIRYIDQWGKVQNYQFYQNSLWDDDRPIISHVRDFRFEYRNEGGYLITHVNRNIDNIETIGYTICILNNEIDILANGRIKIYPVLTLSEVSESDRIS